MRIRPQSSHCFDVAAQRRRAAGFDGAHDAALSAAEMASMGLAVSSAVAAEHIRHLQGGATTGSARRH